MAGVVSSINALSLSSWVNQWLIKILTRAWRLSQVPETLPAEVLGKMHAPPKQDVPIITAKELESADGFVFGFPTRFGMMCAQMKAFFDSTGSQWQTGAPPPRNMVAAFSACRICARSSRWPLYRCWVLPRTIHLFASQRLQLGRDRHSLDLRCLQAADTNATRAHTFLYEVDHAHCGAVNVRWVTVAIAATPRQRHTWQRR